MELKEVPNYILDSQTKSGSRMTSFAVDLTEAVLDFQNWVEEANLTEKEMWYTDVFEFMSKKHMATIRINENGLAIIIPAPEKSRVKLFSRNRFVARMKGELKIRGKDKSDSRKEWK